jgi:hypothetical protein
MGGFEENNDNLAVRSISLAETLKKLRGRSPQANCTDRATAAGRRS